MAYLLYEKGCPGVFIESNLLPVPIGVMIGCVIGGFCLLGCVWRLFKATPYYHYLFPPQPIRFSNLTGFESPESPHYHELN